MPLPTKIVVIGAGSASFGENTLSALLGSPLLQGSRLALVDRNPRALEIVNNLAQRLNREWNCQFDISAHAEHAEALEGAAFVISAIEVGPREALWRQDFEIPLRFGVRQPYAENGGPGGFAHAARNIPPLLGILHDMEQACPDAWFVNYTNPMTRICDAANRYSKIKTVGLCHQINIGYCFAGLVLGQDLGFSIPPGITGMHSDILEHPLRHQVIEQAVKRLEITAAGLNHFTWILGLHDRQTGEDLYPLFRRRWAEYDPNFEPLSRRAFNAFGLFPVPGDTHLVEYLPWGSDPQTKPWEKYHLRLYDWELMDALREFSLGQLEAMAAGTMEIESLRGTDSEGALEVVENTAGNRQHFHPAAVLPNRGQISNLPLGAAVETPAVMSGDGVQPVAVGALPTGIAELCRREIAVSQMCVDAAVVGDYNLALQCLLLDPVITDLDVARQVLDAYLQVYRQHLPQFWK